MVKKKPARKSPQHEYACIPKDMAAWPDGLFDVAKELALKHKIMCVLIPRTAGTSENNTTKDQVWGTYYEHFQWNTSCNPLHDPKVPPKVVIIWLAHPLDPAAVLSWRCALIEKPGIRYRLIFSGPEHPANWKEWLEKELRDWVAPEVAKEPVGLKIHDHICYQSNNPITPKLESYDPSFLTITPGGVMARKLDELDECKRLFASAMQPCNMAQRQPLMDSYHNLLAGEDSNEHGAKLQDTLKNHFNVDRKRLPRVLLLGPSGVGKTLIARYLAWQTPNSGSDQSNRFKRVSLPEYLNRENIFETVLFGYCRGAYTGGAQNGSPGILMTHLGGVIFLDEIGDASPTIQAKLLAFLDDYAVAPMGWNGAAFFCPVLVVAATNLPVESWAEQNAERPGNEPARHFRNDLLRRFTHRIHVPTLKDRRDELPAILDALLQMDIFNPGSQIKDIGIGALKAFQEHDYSRGNFRDLENLFRRACQRVLADERKYMVAADVADQPQCCCAHLPI